MKSQIKQFMNSHPKVAVFGGGSWATAIVKMLCENLETVGWYMRSASTIDDTLLQTNTIRTI